MELVTPHLKSVLKNYQHSATKSLHGPGLSLVPSKEILSPDLNDEIDFVQPPALPFPIQQLPILTTADTSRSERTETILEGESISCFVVGGEKRLCLPQVLNSVLREFSLHQINQECDHLQIYCSRCTPEQLNELKSTGILPHSAPSCGLITKTDAERLCSALLHAATSLHQAAASLRPLPPKGSTPFKVYHECFGKCAGLCTPELFTERGAARCIECVECQGMFTPPQFVCHAHRELENRTCHWGFDSNNWRAYLYVNKEQAECEKYEKALDALKEQLEAGPPAHLVACEVNGNNNHKRKQIHLLDPELVVKGEPLDIPLKKSKLEEYAAYIYAATMDPLYIHTAMYEQYFSRNLNAAYRPIPSIFPTGKEKRHCPVVPSTLGGRYKDPPVLQHPERVVPVSETERFERSFQPNVALAPPTIPRKRYKDQTISDNLVQVKIEPEQYIVKTTDHHPPLDDDDDLISPSVISTIQPDDNNRHIVDSTVSVVQPVALHPRYNSEIELSTDTDDSLSELSDHQKDDKVQQITDLLVNVPNETTAKVLDLVRQIAKENHRIQQENHAKDERIKALELKLLELQPIHTTIIATTTHHSDYEVVTSSRTEITDDSVDESAQSTPTTTRDDIKSVITTATKTDDLAIIIKEEPE